MRLGAQSDAKSNSVKASITCLKTDRVFLEAVMVFPCGDSVERDLIEGCKNCPCCHEPIEKIAPNTRLNEVVLSLLEANPSWIADRYVPRIKQLERLIIDKKTDEALAMLRQYPYLAKARVDETRRTALHFAAIQDEFAVCEALISLGAPIDASSAGASPFDVARGQAKQLLFYHANIHPKIVAGNMEAASAGLVALVENPEALQFIFTQADKHCSREQFVQFQKAVLLTLIASPHLPRLLDQFTAVLQEQLTVDKQTVLHLFAERGNVEGLRAALHLEPSLLNRVDKTNATALIRAIKSNHPEAAEFLLEQKGVDVKIVTSSKSTALHAAASNGYGQVCDLLIAKGAPVDSRNANRKTPLDVAQGPQTKALLFYYTKIKPNLHHPDFGSALAELAKIAEDPEFLRLIFNKVYEQYRERFIEFKKALLLNLIKSPYLPVLLNEFTEVLSEPLDAQGRNILHRLAEERSLENQRAFQVILDLQPDMLNSKDRYGQSALVLAAAAGNHGQVDFLARRPGVYLGAQTEKLEFSALYWADYNGNAKTEKLGFTALHWAAYNGNAKMCESLIEAGASLRMRSEKGRSPMGVATGEARAFLFCHTTTLPALRANDLKTAVADIVKTFADPKSLEFIFRKVAENFPDSDMLINLKKHILLALVPLGKASELLDQFTEVLAEPLNADQQSVLHLFAIAGDLKGVGKVLLKRPDLLNQADKYNETALMHAAYKGHSGVVQFLLKQLRIDVATASIRNAKTNGFTALHWAAMKGRAEICLLLIAAGAPLEALPQSRKTACELFQGQACTISGVKLIRALSKKHVLTREMHALFFAEYKPGPLGGSQNEHKSKPENVAALFSDALRAADDKPNCASAKALEAIAMTMWVMFSESKFVPPSQPAPPGGPSAAGAAGADAERPAGLFATPNSAPRIEPSAPPESAASADSLAAVARLFAQAPRVPSRPILGGADEESAEMPVAGAEPVLDVKSDSSPVVKQLKFS